MLAMKKIVTDLGYVNSESLFYRNDLRTKDLRNEGLSIQTIKLLKSLNPSAFYCVNYEPFVLFVKHSLDVSMREAMHKAIWNAQIPVVIIDCGSHIEIYNGCSLHTETLMLQFVEKESKENMNEFSHFSYWNITNSSYWNVYNEKFSQPKLDTHMLENLSYLIETLEKQNGLLKPFAVQLTLRLIFIRYLIDKGVNIGFEGISNEPKVAQRQLLEVMESKVKLYSLFEHLKIKFNGNIFDYYEGSRTSEMALLDMPSLKVLRKFMSGELELSSGQISLFPLYDFNIIPVELISNIYERLLGLSKQKKDSAFYTPSHLVDYILQQTISPHLQEQTACTVLDPACGSGIFLVETLRKIIENNLEQGPYLEDNELLASLLTDNIFGVDKNSEAINVAIFSLYLTLLDYKNPKCLQDFKLPMLKNTNFFENDFFSPEIDNKFKSQTFDFIIGNPPWGNIKDGLHREYCKENEIPLSNNEIASSFLARVKDFSNENTQCCLIVTSKVFYKKQRLAREFREWLLTNAIIEKFIELSPVRKMLFKEAHGPASILFYSFNKANSSHNIDHITFMPNIYFELFNIIVLETNNWKKIPQHVLLEEDWAWKTMAFGTIHDYYNVKQLKAKYKTMKQVIDAKKLRFGRGIETGSGKSSSQHLIGKKLINTAKGLTPFHLDISQSQIFTQKEIHRSRDRSLFVPPYVLFRKGTKINSYRLRAVYSEEELLYRDAITGIVGTADDKEALLSFTGLINSSFYAYLNVLLGSSIGIEREQVLPSEVLSYPAACNSTLATQVDRIQNLISKQNENQFVETSKVEKLINELDEHVLTMFNLQHDPFVRYMLEVQIPLLTGRSTIFKEVNIEELREYADVFIDYWSNVLNRNDQYVKVVIYPSIMNRFAAIKVFILEEEPIEQISIVRKGNAFLELVSKLTLSKHNDLFYQIKDIINFEEKSFYILKMNESKNWHPAMAELDLSKVLDSILKQKEVE